MVYLSIPFCHLRFLESHLMLLDSVSYYFVEDVNIYVYKWYRPAIFFFFFVCVWYLCPVFLSNNKFESVLSSAIFWKSFWKIGVNTSLNFDRTLFWSQVVLEFCSLDIFKSHLNFSTCDVIYSYFLFLHGSVLEGSPF